jgi:hypothetical protein
VLRSQLELGQVRQEIDQKIREKEEDFANTRLALNLLSATLIDLMQLKEKLQTKSRNLSGMSKSPKGSCSL